MNNSMARNFEEFVSRLGSRGASHVDINITWDFSLKTIVGRFGLGCRFVANDGFRDIDSCYEVYLEKDLGDCLLHGSDYLYELSLYIQDRVSIIRYIYPYMVVTILQPNGSYMTELELMWAARRAEELGYQLIRKESER